MQKLCNRDHYALIQDDESIRATWKNNLFSVKKVKEGAYGS